MKMYLYTVTILLKESIIDPVFSVKCFSSNEKLEVILPQIRKEVGHGNIAKIEISSIHFLEVVLEQPKSIPLEELFDSMSLDVFLSSIRNYSRLLKSLNEASRIQVSLPGTTISIPKIYTVRELFALDITQISHYKWFGEETISQIRELFKTTFNLDWNLS